jgi:hypothetical protein
MHKDTLVHGNVIRDDYFFLTFKKLLSMKLYLLTQEVNTGYDTYDSMVVCAASQDDAKQFHPDGGVIEDWSWSHAWAKDVNHVNCVEIGEASPDQKPGTIIASFNAG